jgi:inosose dehydratase
LISSTALGADDSKQQPAKVDYCFSLYGMRSLKLADALKVCAEIGYDGVEIDSGRGQSGDPARLSADDRRAVRKQLQDLGLSLPGLMENLSLLTSEKQHQQNLDRLKAVGELGHDLSPDAPPIIETILGSRPDRWEQEKEKMATVLGDWAKAAEAAKTVIAIKAHVGGALHTPEGAKWLLDRVDNRWIRLNYDFSHFQLRDFDLQKSLAMLIDRTVFIHVKDNKGRLGGFRFLLPGEGDIDYASYFQMLKDSGYRGAVCVEVSGQIFGKPGYDPVAAARTSYNNLAPLLAKAKLRG